MASGAVKTIEPVWITNLQGMIQRQDLDKTPPNCASLLINIALSKPGTWCKRPGSDLLADTQAGAGVYGLIEYIKNDGTFSVRAVRTRDLDAYTFSTDIYAQFDALQFTASTKVNSVNFLNRVYHASAADNLCYETGGACTDVGAGGNEIIGKYVAVAQRTLYVANVTSIAGAPMSQQSRVYYSLYSFDKTTGANTPTDQLYETTPAQTMANSTRYFDLGKPCKGIFSYNNQLYAFTEDECYQFDIRFPQNDTGPQLVLQKGLANHRAAIEVNGYMVFMDNEGHIWQWPGSGPPIDISWDIEDDTNGEAFINKIDKTQLGNVAAGSLGSEFWFSVGDVTNFGISITNAVLRGFMSKNGDVVSWSVDQYPVKPVIFARATDSTGKKVMLFGSNGIDDVYQMSKGTNDGLVAVSSFAYTKFEDFSSPFTTKRNDYILLKYRPQVSENTFLAVHYATNSNFSYTALSTPDDTTPVTQFGKIDMYSASASTKYSDVDKLRMPNEGENNSISLRFSNIQLGEKFEISGIGYLFSEEKLDKRLQ